MKNLLTILHIDWRESLRSPLWSRKLLINIFMGAGFLYLAGIFVALGVALDDILLKVPMDGIDYNTYGPSFVLRRLDSFLLYYFFFDFVLRYFMQKLPAMSIRPYLHLPIKRSSLVNFLLVKTVWSPFNLFHFLIFIPFMFEVFNNLDFAPALGWSVGFVAIVYANNFGLNYLKRTSEVDTRVYLALLGTLVIVLGLDWFDLVDFQSVSGLIFNQLFLQPWAMMVPIIVAAGCYWINYNYLRHNMYLSRISKSKTSEISYVGSGILSRFGLIGRLTELEFKFIWRNKRPRSVLLLTILFLGYGLIVFPNPDYAGNTLMYILFSIIITGMFMLNYGQYLLGWEGGHFDHILTRNVSFKNYYMSKFLLFVLISMAAMILSIPYAYFGWEVLFVLFCVFLFNMGVNSHIVMFFGSLNPKKVDLTQRTAFNMQGAGAAQFLVAIPILGFPLALYGLGILLWGSTGAVILLGVVGLAGLAGTRFWISLLAAWLKRQRHEISSDFRNQ
ncbi:MAG: DUF5687 family protein [Flavobacteriales bacterium]